MKKNLLLILLLVTLVSIPAYSGEMFENPEDLENMQEIFYEAPAMPIPEVKLKDGSDKAPIKSTPLLKKFRIKLTNYFREKDYNKTLKLLEKEKQMQAEQEAKENEELNKVFGKNFTPAEDETAEKKVQEEVKEGNTLELEGGVKEQVSSNDVMLDADNIDYDEETMDIIATGSPILVFPPHNTTIKAEKMIYNQASNILKAFGAVEVIKDGNSIFGDYMQINMNEENAFIDNMSTLKAVLTVHARKGEMDGDKIVLHDGKLSSESPYILNMHTKMIGGMNFNNMIIDDEEKSSISDDIGNTSVHIKTDEILVNAKKNHDVITLKKGRVDYGDTTIFRFPSFTVHTNKKQDYFEANYPEFGSRSRIGMFAGPGFVFDTPFQGGSSIKALPIINDKDGIGFGGMLKYHSATNHTDAAYATTGDAFVLKGKQYLDDKLFLQYGINSFMDEWFMGPRMAKYDAELVYDDKGTAYSTLGKNLNLNFRHRFGLGYMHNSGYNIRSENISTAGIGTIRTRYMAEATQSLFNYTDKEARKAVDFAVVLQGSAALYGTGDTQFLGRVGPRLHTQYKDWMQDIGYFISGFQDNTPLPAYDMYRYGHSNLYIREALRLNKYLTVAWSGYIALSDDTPDGKMFPENSFILAIGPDDFKINLGYDFVRRQTYFSFVIAMNTKGSSIDYRRMEIKNPDKLAKSNNNDPELKVFEKENPEPKKMMYAEVIEIEDPDKEQI